VDGKPGEEHGGYTVMVSGGKDSSVIADLAILSRTPCKFEVSWTGVEYPQAVYFLRSEKKRIEAMGYSFELVIPRDREGKQVTMWNLIAKHGFPTRHMPTYRRKPGAGRKPIPPRQVLEAIFGVANRYPMEGLAPGIRGSQQYP
jgi:hypothetical protein